MTQHLAFLRAINVGGHTVKMDHLRRLFEEMGFSQVASFIASGNVSFQTDGAPDDLSDDLPGGVRGLEEGIERHLQAALGYEVATFLRTPRELAVAAQYQPFGPLDPEDKAHSLFVAFLPQAPAPEAHSRLLALRSAVDDFHVQGREAWWLRRNGVGPSKFSGGALEKALRLPATMRNVTTVRKLAALYPAPDA